MTKHTTRHYKLLLYYIVAFITCYLTQAILLNRFISLGSIYFVTGGTFIYFISPLILDVVTEVYGYKIAKQLVWSGLFSILFLAICTEICIKWPYPAFWGQVTTAYTIALQSMIRTAFIISIAISIGQFINAYLISKWKILLHGKYFWLRSLGSSVIGDSVNIIISILGVFSGRVSTDMWITNIIPELIVMVTFTAIGAIPASILAKLTAKVENLNHYDTNVNFNPFTLDKK